MRIAVLQTADGPAAGIVSTSGDVPLLVRADAVGAPGTDPVRLATSPPAERARWQAAADGLAAGGPFGSTAVPVANACLEAPVPRPSKMLCLALNYRAHAEEGGFTPPDQPVVFLKGPHTVTGHDHEVVVPPISRQIDHEGELAVVIGRRSRGLTAENWAGAVAGYTNCCDLTARDLQLAAIAAGQPWDLSKNLDGYAPLGPFLVTPDEVPDPQALDLEVRVDGEVRQHGSTKRMIFGVGELLVRLSAAMTLEPGDVLATGTPEGIGPIPDGSTVEVSIGDLGVLRNRVRFEREDPAPR